MFNQVNTPSFGSIVKYVCNLHWSSPTQLDCVLKEKQVKILGSCELPGNKSKKCSGLNKIQFLLPMWDFLSIYLLFTA